ncbi:MAG: DoxX family protein [Opitutales bacterium]
MPKTPSLPSQPSWSVLLLLNRLSVGWYLAVAGWAKAQGELENGLGAFFKGDNYQNRVPEWLPEWLAAAHGYAVPWVELIFGVLLFIGLFTRTSAWVLFLLFISIAIAVLGQGELFPKHHIMVFLTISLLPALYGSGRYGIDPYLPSRNKARD